MSARPSRRAVVAGALSVPVASAAGCTLSGPAPQRTRVGHSPEVDPDVVLLDRVATSTEALVALYEAVVERHRGLRGDLRPLLAAHRAHAAALGDAAPAGRDSARGGGSARRRRERQPVGRGEVDVPRRPEQAVARLRAAEREASAELLDATRRAVSGAFARLLASMSASSAQAVRVLREVDGR